MDTPSLTALPEELLEAIIFQLPPDATLAIGATCRTLNKIAYEPLVWRRHCIETWTYWNEQHDLPDKLLLPAAQTRWRDHYNARRRTDARALDTFNALLLVQQHRIQRIEEIATLGYDVKELLLRLRDHTPDDAEDVLARRYYADIVLAQIHRNTALHKWSRLQKRQMVRLEEVLGAYDLFVLAGARGDLDDIDHEFDRIAAAVRATHPAFDELPIRQKAIEVARYLRQQKLVGNPSEENYHALRNNFLSIALFQPPHTSLPLQSVAIYCAVARRLGVNAKPSNYPSHVHAVIEAPPNYTLNGKERTSTSDDEPEIMHMDPWRSSDEVPREHLTLRLSQMGAPREQHAAHLGASNNFELTLRTGRNIMTSVQEMRDRQRAIRRWPSYPDIEAAWYGMLWSMMILGDTNPAATLHRRRQCLPYLADHFQNHFPEDLGLLETVIAPMFHNEREHTVLMHLITTARAADRNAKAPSPRSMGIGDAQVQVEFKVGQHFRHKRYGYEGIIVGWSAKCSADPTWIHQMRVDDLPRGRGQPFYNVIGEDKSQRYVAEENIEPLFTMPVEPLMQLAGRHFKRWDDQSKMFVSNMKDEYPDD